MVGYKSSVVNSDALYGRGKVHAFENKSCLENLSRNLNAKLFMKLTHTWVVDSSQYKRRVDYGNY